MPYLIQGDEFEIGLEWTQRLAPVMAESSSLVLADATHRVRQSFGIIPFDEREEAERVGARFAEMGFANFVVDDLLPLPPFRLLGPGGQMPEEKIGLVALGRLLLEEKRTVREGDTLTVGVSYARIPIGHALPRDATVTRERTRYYLDLLTRGKHWRVRAGTLARIVAVYTDLDVSEAYLNDGVRSLSRSDERIRAFRQERDWDRYLTWLLQLRYA
jgi:hypothetical protein